MAGSSVDKKVRAEIGTHPRNAMNGLRFPVFFFLDYVSLLLEGHLPVDLFINTSRLSGHGVSRSWILPS